MAIRPYTMGQTDLREQTVRETVRECRDYFTAVLMYRCLKGDAPFYLTTHFTTIQHNHCTRRSLSDVYVPRPNIELFKQSLLYQGPIL